VDYAGLFPPAKLDLQQAMTNYAHYCMAAERWMLGRFVLPASQLNEFAALLPTFPCHQWPLSVVMSGNLQTAIAQVQSFNHDQIAIKALEFPPLTPMAIGQMLPLLLAEVETFFEVPCNRDLSDYLKVLQPSQAAAKIRTGGITADAFPSGAQLCQVILALAAAKIPFKATAGLHHPLPANYPLTDESDSDSTWMHGFLNVATLAALAFKQTVSWVDALEILQTPSLDRIQCNSDRIAWKTYQLNHADITLARQHCFRSFGSCSFQTPIADLKELNLL
jgi:hypothetical protein